MRIALIVAMGRNRVIGRQGALPWRLASDLAFFRATTMGKPVVMGRKTWHSIGRPLPGRHNIVVSRDPALPLPEGVERAGDLEQALRLGADAAARLGAEEIMVIGGAEIYAQALPLASCVHCTEVDAEPEGDAYFPALDPAAWREVARETRPAGAKDDHGFALVRYDRRGQMPSDPMPR